MGDYIGFTEHFSPDTDTCLLTILSRGRGLLFEDISLLSPKIIEFLKLYEYNSVGEFIAAVEFGDYSNCLEGDEFNFNDELKNDFILLDSNVQSIINNSSDVWETTGETSVIDMYMFNMITQSWNQCVNIIGTGAGSLDAISNIVNYIDENQVIHTLFLVGEEDVYEFKGTEDIVTNSKATRVFNLTTKDIHAGAPHVRKKFYKAYITYKGLTNASGLAPSSPAVVPTVKAIITHASGKTTSTLSGTTSFAHPGQSVADDWRTAEYRIDTNIEADKIASRNTYSIQLVISGDNVYQNFKINDISLVFRPKSVK